MLLMPVAIDQAQVCVTAIQVYQVLSCYEPRGAKAMRKYRAIRALLN